MACGTLSACTPNTDAINQQASYQRLEGQTMGTSYHITFKVPANADISAIQASIDARLDTINQSMSTYMDDSTISKFNRLDAHQPMVVDADFIKVLQDSREIFTKSGGSFDPTVYPLVELWGFGSKFSVERLQSPPSQDEIAAVKDSIGLDKVALDGDKLSKTHAGVGLDFSAIAKGYGVDVIAQVLHDDYQIQDYLVEIGGEVASRGTNAKSQAWTLAVDAPIADSTTANREIIATITQTDGQLNMATSGGYRNAIEYDGVRYSHTIDPRTDSPVANSAPSVTVLADTTALADGWATALTALPYDEALALANTQNIKALFVIENPNSKGFSVVKSEAYQKLGL
ncbi:thiamine biosynthesis protein [Moraxella caviae]|uniref:FAD:protein FMN transferase n=1 Tax=Moraxella caviae TaxID=34060 RepID=A0A1T0A6H1_9GAMM|nr:thiamine biosynthesis protein [Moraxella caviae]